MTESPASEALRERRAQVARERRARARRRGLIRLGLLAAVVAGGVVALVVSLGGGGGAKPVATGPQRTVVTLAVSRAGALPAAVQDAAVASAGRSLLLLGGIDSAGRSTAAIVALTGARAAVRGRLPEIQHDAQAAVLGGRVYVFGGGDIASYSHIVSFDPASGAIAHAGSLPGPASDVAVATIGSTAYVVGGFNGVAALDEIVAWRPGAAARVVARLPFALRYAAVAAVGGRLLIAGGTEADGSVSDAIFSYDPADGAVVEVGVLPRAVTHASAVAYGGRVYLIGGRRSAAGAQTAAVVAIDPASDRASVVGRLPAALSDAAVALRGSAIVVAGGEDAAGRPQATVLALTPLARRVAAVAVSRAVLARAAWAELTRLGYAQALRAHPSSIGPYEAAAMRPGLPGYLLIADRGNNRILVIDPQGRVVWRFPTAADVAAGRLLHFNDDTFVEPGGRSLIANEEDYGDVVSVNIRSHRITVLFGVPGVLGGGPTHLNYPDDAYAFPDGSWTVADAYNCRILFVRAHVIIREYGRSGDCRHDPPAAFGAVNGDTPTPYGGVLVSEIPGHWIDAINADGTLRWAVQAPIAYPSDPQPLPDDHVLLADYSAPGHIIVMDRHGRVLWHYGPASGEAALDHPSLAMQLPNGDIAVNDDYRDRVVVIDPRSDRIVWQYGHTDVPGTAAGYLRIPDGMDFVPAGPGGAIDWAATVHP
jgi:N-acetylneuraminic acid mutarotase